jgi:hypothetical protein
MPRLISYVFLLAGCVLTTNADTLRVGIGQPYATIRLACLAATPGDVVLLTDAIHTDASTVDNLVGRADAYVTITGRGPAQTRVEGGRGLQFSRPAFIRIENLTMSGQTGNAINIDDGGTITQPAHHVEVRNVHFERMQATGNIDYLKLSGLDTFLIDNVVMVDGAAGGSGIDMVGCHEGTIQRSRFSRMGSNAIQAKGGTRWITIRQCAFLEGGQRALNLGGSTGLAFFRPADAPHEAADLLVHSNLFVGGPTPFGYVGCERVRCINNTIVQPSRWIFRILQETVDPTRFVPCGNNVFRNNLVVYDAQVSTHVNVGPNTAAETFSIDHNVWFNVSDASRSQPQLPVNEVNGIYGRNPMLVLLGDSISVGMASVLAGRGVADPDVPSDYNGRAFATPPSVGAVEVGSATSVTNTASFPLHGGELFDDFDLAGRPIPGSTQATGIILRVHRLTNDVEVLVMSAGHVVARAQRGSGNR